MIPNFIVPKMHPMLRNPLESGRFEYQRAASCCPNHLRRRIDAGCLVPGTDLREAEARP
jgi:hypothetical protein